MESREKSDAILSGIMQFYRLTPDDLHIPDARHGGRGLPELMLALKSRHDDPNVPAARKPNRARFISDDRNVIWVVGIKLDGNVEVLEGRTTE